MSKFIIKNPEQNMYGNQKENILIAFDEKGNYLGRGYIFPNINYDMAVEHPLNIYIDIEMQSENELGDEVSGKLLNELIMRAKEVQKEYKDIKSRLYTGCMVDEVKKYNFFISKGFIHDGGTYLLECDLNSYINKNVLLSNIEIREGNCLSSIDQINFIELHNTIFIKTIDDELLDKINRHEMVKYYTAYNNDEVIGNILIYAERTEDDLLVGKIENLFVVDKWRKSKIARYLMNKAIDYFNKNDIKTIQLEVWNANKIAYSFYQNLGFRFKDEIELYLGIYL